MKKFLNFILVVAAIAAFASCSVDEIDNIGSKGTVKFVVRPTNFISYNVSDNTTKALTTTQLTALERKIVNAFFLVFDSNNKRIIYKELTVSNNNIPSQELDLGSGTREGTITACFIANIPSSYIENIQTYDELKKIELKIEDYASYEDTGYIGIPEFSFGGTTESCFPMYGEIEYDLSSENVTSAPITIELKRLFAKVNFEIDWDFQLNTNILGEQGFVLNYYTINNLPKYVSLIEPESETSWVKSNVYFNEPIKVENSAQTGIIDNIEFTIYVPEYILLPEDKEVEKYSDAGDDKQKYKPILYDPDKNPISLYIDGIVKSTNFMDVPIKYNIYLGENNFDSFSLRRNNQYNNTITVTGTGDAILGTDHRVEATFYNLADPTNSGTDTSANCYIIGMPGRYLIPTYEGNSSTILTGNDISIHTDGSNNITNTRFIADSAGRNWIMFDVNMGITEDDNGNAALSLSDIDNGNSVLELKDGSNTVWSWHLWFTEGGVLGSEWGAIGEQTYDTEAIMMNRNLGSSGAGNSDGMYYQWGDKDPYFTTSGDGGSSAYHGGGDTDGDWSGDTKSVTDPCPPGYKVPSAQVWSATAPESSGHVLVTTGLTTNAFKYMDISTVEKVYYPYSEYILENKDINTNTTNYVPFLAENESYTITSPGRSTAEKDKVSVTIRILFRDRTFKVDAVTEDIFVITNMDIEAAKKEGRVWCYDTNENPGYLFYSNSNVNVKNFSDIASIQSKLRINSYTHKRKKAVGYNTDLMDIDWGKMINNILSGKFDFTDDMLFAAVIWGDEEEITPPIMTDNDKTILLTNLLTSGKIINKTEYNIMTESVNSTEGYQVRCVKE